MKLPIRIALAVLSGALLPLCFPAFGWWPVILLVFPPLSNAPETYSPLVTAKTFLGASLRVAQTDKTWKAVDLTRIFDEH
ncbi:MAG: hypothetical protein GXY61_07210 [Lentisphaerae bacterium]|jgi:apolipoprotein N-acyltransferase|nr:hypothetical protein [Lentisphaerota bacterium]